jgi:hypothetical protein
MFRFDMFVMALLRESLLPHTFHNRVQTYWRYFSPDVACWTTFSIPVKLVEAAEGFSPFLYLSSPSRVQQYHLSYCPVSLEKMSILASNQDISG